MELQFGSSATLRDAAALRQQCIDALEESEPIIIDIQNILEADLSFIQVIYALRAAAGQSGRAVRLRAPAPAPVTALLERAGFLAAPAADDLDFWFHGERAQ